MAKPSIASASRKHIQVRGVVQGVGFRPFVYKLAQSLGLTGYVFNSSAGVTIEIEGGDGELNTFIERLRADPPQLAEVTDITVSEMKTRGGSEFSILRSRHEAGEFAMVSPDAGTCEACCRDFGDRLNRRFGYPFTNCTHCGPRYTIIHDIPYDRARTTMSAFVMCADCRTEYEDPEDRRFHAQPNACAVCGPSLMLVERGSLLENCSFTDTDSLTVIRETRRLLREGKIVAVKGLGGFLLACDAENEVAVAKLRRRKRRPDKPFALRARDIAAVEQICEVSTEDEVALLSARRPIVILPRRERTELARGIAPGNETFGVMLPYTPLHYLLFSDSPDTESEFVALVMTSGNMSEEPIVVSNAEAMRRLDRVADWFLLHNRDISMRIADPLPLPV